MEEESVVHILLASKCHVTRRIISDYTAAGESRCKNQWQGSPATRRAQCISVCAVEICVSSLLACCRKAQSAKKKCVGETGILTIQLYGLTEYMRISTASASLKISSGKISVSNSHVSSSSSPPSYRISSYALLSSPVSSVRNHPSTSSSTSRHAITIITSPK